MTDDQTVELLPCPFCGGDPYTRTTQDEDLNSHSIVDWHFVGCVNCDVSFGIPDGYDCGTASEQWNTRAAMQPALAEIAILRTEKHADAEAIGALREVLQEGVDLIEGEADGMEWKRGCRVFIGHARNTLKGDTP